jgi:hypothetical protein
VKPVLQALLIADNVYQDKTTEKKIIAGVFNAVVFGIPAKKQVVDKDGQSQVVARGGLQAGSPDVYINLTDVHDQQEFDLRFVDLQENKPLIGACFSVKSRDRLAAIEVIVPLPPLPIPHPGVYALELLWKGEILGSLRINAIDASKDQNDEHS